MRKLAIFACGFTLAVMLYVWLMPPQLAIWFAFLLTLAGLAFMFVHTDWAKRTRILALGMVLGLLWSQCYEKLQLEPLRSHCGEAVQLTAEVCQAPQATKYGTRVQTRVDGGKLLLYLDCAPEELALGDRVHLTAEVADVSRGSGDENNLYYQSNDISLLGFQRGSLTVEKAKSIQLRYYPQIAASAVREKITGMFPDDTEGFVLALLTGERDGMSFQIRNDMSITGISHVVSVSGMHVTLIVGAIQLFCLRRKRLAAAVSLAVMLFFAAMLGFAPSVTRAVIMNTVLLVAPLVRRENDSLTSLSFALMLILMFNPWAIANVSLQLSFAAMVGIFLVTPKIYGKIMRAAREDEWNERYPRCHQILRSVVVTFATTLGANIVTLPFVAVYFGTISLVSPLTNSLLLPIISFVFTASFVLLIFVFVCSLVPFFGIPAMFLAENFAWLLSWPIRFVLRVIEGLADIPYAAVYTCSGYVVAWLVFSYVLGAIYTLWRRRCRLRILLACIALPLVVACVLSAMPRGTTAITAFDVGQGQCILLRSGDFTVLVDCGGDEGDYNGEDVARSLLMAGYREIDALVLTHYDTDHTCGVEQLLDRIEVGELFLPEVSDDSGNKERILTFAERTKTMYSFVRTDTTLYFANGTLSLLVPPDPNADNASLSALMSAEECDILVTGDLSDKQEIELLRTHDLPDLEVLVAGHHGSKHSTSTQLLEATTPDAVLICVGENRYGHPSAEVLERIGAIGAAVYRTDENGEITISR